MKKLPLKAAAILLIIFGWIQEIYYYHYTFTANGLSTITALTAGASLSLLLGYFSYKKNYPLFIALLIFSIITTVLGQTASYSTKQQAYSIDTAVKTELTATKQYYTDQIEQLNDTIQLNENLLPKTVQERANWATKGVKPLEEKIEKLKAERSEYEQLLSDVSNKLSTGTKEFTAFESITKDLPFLSPIVIKYVFIVFMSLFIALMAPAGITILSTGNTQVKPKRVEKSRVATKKEDIYSVYANARYGNSEQPGTLKSRKDVCESTGMSYSDFNKITKRAVQAELIAVQGNKSVPMVSRSEFEMRIRNKQQQMRAVR